MDNIWHRHCVLRWYRRAMRREWVFRDHLKPLDFHDDVDFVQRHLVALLSDRLQSTYNDISPTNKVLLMLQFYATSSMQRVVGDLAGVSVSSAKRIIISLSWEIALLKGRYISFPSRENTDTTKLMFYNIAQFPNIIGTIHCTHIPIVNPCGEDGARVVNRKGFYSLNVQVVSNAEMFITNTGACWPGSSHDSRVFTNRRLGPKLEAGQYRGCCLLEDGGCACTSYMMTPLRNPVSEAERNYNITHAQTRFVIEHLFGILKARFPFDI